MKHDRIFYNYFGTVAPEWRFHENSQTLDFLNIARKSCLVVPLDFDRCTAVRTMRSYVSSIEIPVWLFNSSLMVRLVGRKTRSAEWGGLVSAYRYLHDTAIWS